MQRHGKGRAGADEVEKAQNDRSSFREKEQFQLCWTDLDLVSFIARGSCRSVHLLVCLVVITTNLFIFNDWFAFFSELCFDFTNPIYFPFQCCYLSGSYGMLFARAIDSFALVFCEFVMFLTSLSCSGLNFELNSVSAGEISSAWAAAIPQFLQRRCALAGPAILSRRGSMESEYSASLRRSLHSELLSPRSCILNPQ